MKLSFENLGIGAGVVFAGLISWFGAAWLHPHGANVWVLRIAMFLFLLLVIGAIVLWQRKKAEQKASAGAGSGAAGGNTEDSGLTGDVLIGIREAEAKIASSPRVPHGTKLSDLPVIFVVGESASGKSCTVLYSGLEPELLTGQVFQEGKIISTRLANLWFARKVILFEVGGKLMGDAHLWSRMLRRLSPSRLRGLFGRAPKVPRVAVVCVDAEKFVKVANPDELTASARALRARLEQISAELGISLPVYVIFARTDRLPFFEDYFRNLGTEENAQVLGTTLPALTSVGSGVYQEQESKRLSGALKAIFQSLAECRPGMLARQNSSESLAGIYEFPREFEKRIPLIAQYLVDLCRPSQLSTGPFLRGFYFTGTRLIETQSVGATVLQPQPSFDPRQSKFAGNATSIMRVDEAPQGGAWQSQTLPLGAASSGQKTTQWLFLSHVFSHVILEDRAALGASGSSTKSSLPRRIVYGVLTAIALIWLFGMLVSYFNNRDLQARVLQAGRGIAPFLATKSSAATSDELKRLDNARLVLEELNGYQRHVPLAMRWGLYSGEGLYKDFRALYFDRFKKLLFGDVQNQMAAYLRARPLVPTTPTDNDYTATYNTLKAYLMTTTRPDKSNTPFLSQFLLSKWQDASTSPEQNHLADEQFKYYADELRMGNPFPANDTPLVNEAIERGRQYLRAFASADLVYQGYLAKLHQTGKYPSLNFSAKYPDATRVVVEPRIVDGAFTRDGWGYMLDLITQNEWNNEEEWVLGAGTSAASMGVNSSDVMKVYEREYVATWRAFVRSASVQRLGGPGDASQKLERLTGNRSPLFQLFCEVSENTNVHSEEILKAFQPVRDVVKAPCYSLVAQDTTKAYVNALADFKLCIDQYSQKPDDPGSQRDDVYKSCRTQDFPVVTKEARNVVKTVDGADLDKCVLNLLELGACQAVKPPPPPVVPDVFCAAVYRLSMKYPFKAEASEDATFEEFENFFRPGTGILSQEIASGGAKGSSRAGLLKLGESIQKSLYPPGATTPQFHFSVTATVPQGLKSGKLNLDGIELPLVESTPKTQIFEWPGQKREAELQVGGSKYYGPFAGPWAVFRLLGSYNWSATRGGYHLESPPLNPPEGGVPFKDSLEVRTEGVPLFRRGYLAQLRCSASAQRH